jgi:fibronectin-binding autotransporter adhesin
LGAGNDTTAGFGQLDQDGDSVLNANGGFRAGVANADCLINMSGSATTNFAGYYVVGDGETGLLVGATVDAPSTGTLNMSEYSVINGAGNFHIGFGSYSAASVNMSQNAHLNLTSGSIFVGYALDSLSSSGTITMTGQSQINAENSNAQESTIYLGYGPTGPSSGTLVMGVLNSATDTPTVSSFGMEVGTGRYGTGNLTVYGGSVTLGYYAAAYGWNNGGVPSETLAIGKSGGNGTVVFSGTSQLTVYGATRVGEGAAGVYTDGPSVGSLTLSGSASMVTATSFCAEGIWGGWFLNGDVVVGDDHWNQGVGWYQGFGRGQLTVTDHASLNLLKDLDNGLGYSKLILGSHGGIGTGVISGSATVYAPNVILGNGTDYEGATASQGNLSVSDHGVLTTETLTVAVSWGWGTMTVSDNATVTATDLRIGCSGGSGVMTVGGAGTAVVNADALHMDSTAWSGVLTVNAGGSVTIGGSSDHMVIGASPYGWDMSRGTINVTGGVFHRLPGYDTYYGGDWRTGAGYGTLNVSGGLYLDEGLVYFGEVGLAYAFCSGGTISTPAGMILGSAGGYGFLIVSGSGLVTTPTIAFQDGTVSSLILRGGVCETGAVYKNSPTGTATVSFEGGTLRALADNDNFIDPQGYALSIAVESLGGTIDTQNFNVGVQVPLQQGTTVGGGVTKTGTGTLVLSAANTYTGLTEVQQGTLQLVGVGSLAGDASVAAGATLSGNGSVAGSVQAVLASIVAPGVQGTSLGTLTIGGDATVGGTLFIEYDALASQPIDVLAVAGALDLSGATIEFNQIGAALTAPVYVLATYGSLTSPAADVASLPSGYTLDYGYNGGTAVALVQVPEPTTLALLAMGLFGLVAYAWRKRK